MRNPEEVWQVEVNGQIYDTTFGDLPSWIADNALLETDKVRRGELRWLEAGKVPALVPFFNAKAEGTLNPSPVISTTVATTEVESEEGLIEDSPASVAGTYGTWSNDSFPENEEPGDLEDKQELALEPEAPPQDICSIHPDVPSSYLCSTCRHAFCGECPEGFGATVRLCPYCGALCKEISEAEEQEVRERRIRDDIGKGFGFDDFGKALSYPFRFKGSLFTGGLLFAILGIGQGAGSMGSIFLVAAALICFMMANAITFGVLANTIDKFSRGVIDKDFMPSFEDFSIWDDVVHPFFLSIAVYLSSFGLFIVLVLGFVWFAWNSFAGVAAPAADPTQTMLEDAGEGESPHLKQLIEKAREQNQGRTDIEVGEDGLTDLQRSTLNEEAEFMRLNDMAQNYRTQQLESVVGPSPETRDENFRAALTKFFEVAGVFVIFAGVALLWGFFYFPAACAVAGYTRSFRAAINPLVGIDTIRHLGVDYVKILVMVLVISIMSGVVGAVLGVVFMPFDLPAFGNLPAKFVGSFVTFYFSVVLAVTLGYALYKNSEKLRLYRD